MQIRRVYIRARIRADADMYTREYVQMRIHTDAYTYRRMHRRLRPRCVYISDDACKMYVRTWTPPNTNPLYLALSQVLTNPIQGRLVVSMREVSCLRPSDCAFVREHVLNESARGDALTIAAVVLPLRPKTRTYRARRW